MNGKLMGFIKAVVRPTIALSGWGTLIYAVLMGLSVPDWFITNTIVFSVWWFSDRKASDNNGESS